MTTLEFMLLALVVSVGAGAFGAILGLGGGIVVVPALTLLLHVDIRYAIGASVISVIATSSGAGAAYVRQGLANIRVSMLLETATCTGAVAGAFVAGLVHPRWLFGVFGAVLALSAIEMRHKGRQSRTADHPDALSRRLALGGSYFDHVANCLVAYRPRRTAPGLLVSLLAGAVSGLLGIGGGVIKVPAMNLVMGIPLKVAAATSNFMIGVTAAAGAGVYFHRGDVNPFIAAPVALGVTAGAIVGTRLLERLPRKTLRAAFTVVLLATAAQMLWRALG